ncbi:MAG TPA: LysM domain-containing protein [Deltaproteobacteria bacterium]|nr:LysM domain-containing protein [Deltaproteobacteria bacterium]
MRNKNFPRVMMFLMIFFLVTYPSPSVSGKVEDTAHLTLQKTIISKKSLDTYVVQKGDWIFNIIRQKFGASEKEIVKILEQVKQLNPEIRDIHRISPGQELILPNRETLAAAEAESKTRLKKSQGNDKDAEEASALPYVVKEGETLSDIIHSELSAVDEDIYRMLRTVKRLNPNVKNINKIYPGQKLLLPYVGSQDRGERGDQLSGKGTSFIAVKRTEPTKVVKKKILREEEPVVEKEPAQLKEEKKTIIPPEKKIAVIRYILSRINGSVISEGKYFIPLFPTGQITVDCSSVPVIELDDGMTVLLDFSGSIPSGIKQVIETTWKNYVIMNIGYDKDVPFMVEEIINKSKDYSCKSVRNFVTVGHTPSIRLYVDWIVSETESKGEKPYSFGIKNVKNSSSLLPGNIREYSDKKGFEVVELLRGSEVVAMSETFDDAVIPVLAYETNAVLAESLLTILGYEPEKAADVEIYNMKEHGFSLLLKVDLFLTFDNKRVILHSKQIPQHFIDALKERGMNYVFLPPEQKKESVVETVLSAIEAPFVADTFRFSFSQSEGKIGGDIVLAAIRTVNKNKAVYFVTQDIDPGINGLLQKKWGVDLIRY